MKQEPEPPGLKADADLPAPRTLLPASGRTGRACASVRYGASGLVAALKGGRWSLPSGGLEPGEMAARTAVRGAWENVRAQVVAEGELFSLTSPHGREPSLLVSARSVRQKAGLEDRGHAWADPTGLPWGDGDPPAPSLVVPRQRGWR